MASGTEDYYNPYSQLKDCITHLVSSLVRLDSVISVVELITSQLVDVLTDLGTTIDKLDDLIANTWTLKKTDLCNYGTSSFGAPHSTNHILFSRPTRNSAIISAKDDNVEPVYVGFDDEVSPDKFAFVLNKADKHPFQSYTGDVYVYGADPDKVSYSEFYL